MLIVFVVDTSASMNQMTSNGLTFLDYAKSSIERFVASRRHNPTAPGNPMDRYFLVTTGESYTDAVQIGWNASTNSEAFHVALKNLVARDLSDIGSAIGYAFDLLNQFRVKYRVSTVGQGYLPTRIEPGAVIVLTDAISWTNPTDQSGTDSILIPQSKCHGSEFTLEPYRWDQRLYSIQLQLDASGASGMSNSSFNNSSGNLLATPVKPQRTGASKALKALCEETGGAAFFPSTHRNLLQLIDMLVTKVRKVGPTAQFRDDFGKAKRIKSMLRPSASGSKAPRELEHLWPIPEEYWMDRSLSTIPRREAQPTLIYNTSSRNSNRPTTAAVLSKEENAIVKMMFDTLCFPYDSYTLETNIVPSFARRGSAIAGQRFNVYRPGSSGIKGKPLGDPIGFINSVSTNGNTSVILILLPYNYLALFKLLVEAARMLEKMSHAPKAGHPWIFQQKMMPAAWRQALSAYVSNVPVCYYGSLHRALKMYNLHSFVPIVEDGGVSYAISSMLKRMRESAKSLEADRQAEIEKKEAEAAKIKGAGYPDKFSMLQSLSKARPNTMRGLHNGWGGNYAKLAPDIRALKDDVNHAIPIHKMADYFSFLNSQEAPRDPLGEPEKDEDTPAGLHRRRQKIYFGSPYSKSPSKNSGSDAVDDEAADEAMILQKRQASRSLSPRRSRSKQRVKQSRKDFNRSPHSSPSRSIRVQDAGIVTGITANLYRTAENNQEKWNHVLKLIRSNRPLLDSEIETIRQQISELEGGPSAIRAYRQQALSLSNALKRSRLCQALSDVRS